MDITDRLYVEIHPLTQGQIPRPHPVEDAGFDPQNIYKVLGMYNPSETSECYMILSNPKRQIWFIPQRHLLAFALIDSDEFFLPIAHAQGLKQGGQNGQTSRHKESKSIARLFPDDRPVHDLNGHATNHRLTPSQIP